ncbi:hypothetical protein ACWCXX_30565 [Streptomyces sp. NPDC001732]
MSSTHTVLYDPEGQMESELLLDCGPHKCLIKAVLTWRGEPNLPTADNEQIALQLTGAAMWPFPMAGSTPKDRPHPARGCSPGHGRTPRQGRS